MSIERRKPPRPCFVKDLIATQLMIDPGEPWSEDPRAESDKYIRDSIGAGLVRTHQAIQSLRDAQFRFNRIEAATVHRNIAKALIQIAESGSSAAAVCPEAS